MLNKRKYKKEQVQEMLDALTIEYEEKISSLRSEIGVLTEKNNRIYGELSLIKDREHLIDVTLQNANKQAEEITSNAKLQYEAVMESLKRFSNKWRNYFTILADKYPLYPSVQKALQLKEQLDSILNSSDYSVNIEKLEANLDKNISDSQEVFDPKQKINDYILATSDNGFNIDEVLNPGELELEDLCKELGLMED